MATAAAASSALAEESKGIADASLEFSSEDVPEPWIVTYPERAYLSVGGGWLYYIPQEKPPGAANTDYIRDLPQSVSDMTITMKMSVFGALAPGAADGQDAGFFYLFLADDRDAPYKQYFIGSGIDRTGYMTWSFRGIGDRREDHNQCNVDTSRSDLYLSFVRRGATLEAYCSNDGIKWTFTNSWLGAEGLTTVGFGGRRSDAAQFEVHVDFVRFSIRADT